MKIITFTRRVSIADISVDLFIISIKKKIRSMIFDKLIGNINCLSNEKNMGSRSGLAVWSRNSFSPYKINAILASMGSNKRRHILYKKVSSQVCRSLFPTMTSALYYKLTTSFSKYCLLHLFRVLLNTNIFLK